MTLFSRACALILIVLGSYCLGSDESPLEPQDGVLVLRNGFILQGRITPLNDLFLVTISSGGEVRLPRADVEFQCRNLDEAYIRRRDALLSDDPAAHLSLADWCIRHKLLARTSDQLLIVYAKDPGHPRLPGLEQRLASLGVQSVPAQQASKPPPDSIPVPVSGSGTGTATATATVKLSPQLMQQFTTVIQPILLNRCAAYTCHGNGSAGKFRLIRPSSGNATTSRVTQRNLQATQMFMDPEHPENSPLLARGSVPHGGAKTSTFTDKNANQLDLLSAWIRRTANTPTESIAANSGGPKRSDNRTAAKPTTESAFAPAATKKSPASDSAVVPAGHVESVPQTRFGEGASNQPAGRDPFDPEVFNRQYHSTKP